MNLLRCLGIPTMGDVLAERLRLWLCVPLITDLHQAEVTIPAELHERLMVHIDEQRERIEALEAQQANDLVKSRPAFLDKRSP